MGKLKLNGKPFEAHPKTEGLKQLLVALNKLPSDEIYTADQLDSRMPMSVRHAVIRFADSVAEFNYIHRHVRYWGSPAAIKELKRAVQQ